MFSDFVTQTAVSILAMLAAGGVAWVFLYPYLSGEAAAAQRLDRIATGKAGRSGKNAQGDTALRRKTVEDSLKSLEERHTNSAKSPSLAIRLEQAGLSWDRNAFLMVSAICGAVAYVAVYSVMGNLPIASLAAVAAGIGAPRWYLSFGRKRRITKFIDEFPNALDVIVRGVKAGLPLIDCIRICSQESSEPVRSEFRMVMEAQSLNVPISTAVEMLYERVPVAEANYFSIVISVQQKSGGNLSEILSNLSKVLRDRKKMKAKARALAQEAVASASIIGSLPLVVTGLIYMMDPTYIEMLWQKPLGQIMLAGAAVWMSIGIFVMRRMINFNF